MNKRKRARIELLDIAKAITILLVILGHTTGNTDTIMYRRVLYSFHMPLFFFLAGMSTKAKIVTGLKGWRIFLKKNALALIAPYMLWGLVYGPFSFANFRYLFYGSWEALGEMGTLTSLWYLTGFFVARLIVQIIVNVLGKTPLRGNRLALGLCTIPLFAIGMLLPHPEAGLPWCLDIAFVAAGFVMLGMALNVPFFLLAIQKMWVLLATLVASLALFIAGTVVRGDALDLVLMCAGSYGNRIWFFLNAFSGSLIVLAFSMILIRIAHEGPAPFSLKAVNFIGLRTMGIFLLHKPFLQEVLMPIFSQIPGPALIGAILASIVALAVSLLFCVIIELYVPQALGQFPVYGDDPRTLGRHQHA